MPKILITQPMPPGMVAQMQAALGPQVTVAMVESLDEAEFARLAADAEVLLTIYRRVDSKLLALAPKVKFIQQCSVGYNNIDLEAVAKAGLRCANAAGANSGAVAEHTILLMLAVLKRFREAEQSTRQGKWEDMPLMQAGIGDLAGATVGLIGMGDIGRATAQRLRPFGCRLLYNTRRRLEAATEAELGLSYASLEELLVASQIVSLHLPLNEQTQKFIGKKELAQLPRGAILVNTGRGGLVDEAALREAIESGHLTGAGLDVLENERPGGNPFTDLPQVVVTPHSAGLSRAAAGKVMEIAISNLMRYFAGQAPLHLLPGKALNG